MTGGPDGTAGWDGQDGEKSYYESFCRGIGFWAFL